MKTFDDLVSITCYYDDHYPKPVLETSGYRDTIRIPSFDAGLLHLLGLTATRFNDNWIVIRDDGAATTIRDSDTTAREIWEFRCSDQPSPVTTPLRLGGSVYPE